MADGGSVRDRDRGAKALLKRFRTASEKPATVKIGVLEAEGAVEHGDEGPTVAEIATYNEFGLGVPERSFIRAYVDENEAVLQERMRKIAQAIKDGKIATPEQGLERFGLLVVGEIQSRISDGIEPPNAESTIARKGSSTPLIAGGLLRTSVTHKVE